MSRVFTTRNLIIGVGIMAVATILALVLAVLAQGKAADAAKVGADAQARAAVVSTEQARLAKVQADQADHQARLLRDAICGTFVDVAAAPITPETTALGKRLIRDTDRGATVAGCPRP
jgi:hypothetical protein